MNSYSFNFQYIDQYAWQIFQMYDRDRSGNLEMNEFPMMCSMFFQYMNMPPPTQNDIMYLMYYFDSNRDGKISFNEFRNMLYFIGGRKQ